MDDPQSLRDYLQEVYQYLNENPEKLNFENTFGGIVYAALSAKVGNYDMALGFLEMEEKLSQENINHDAIAFHVIASFHR